MNLKDEFAYYIYKYLDGEVKPGKATKYSKDIAKIIFDELIKPKWREMARLKLETMTEEMLNDMGYVRRDDEGEAVV